jgi:hypothetical protein
MYMLATAVPGWLQRHLPVHGRGWLCPGTMGYAREPVFLLSHSHPHRPRLAREGLAVSD